jgi:hypothetical protein
MRSHSLCRDYFCERKYFDCGERTTPIDLELEALAFEMAKAEQHACTNDTASDYLKFRLTTCSLKHDGRFYKSEAV